MPIIIFNFERCKRGYLAIPWTVIRKLILFYPHDGPMDRKHMIEYSTRYKEIYEDARPLGRHVGRTNGVHFRLVRTVCGYEDDLINR